jgi:hypothetical protein
MHRVEIPHCQPTQAIELKNRLLADGLALGRDFEWRYSPATYDNDGFTAVTPRQAVYEFADPALATFYKLKWTGLDLS